MKKIFGSIVTCLTLLALIFGAPGTTATYAAPASADPVSSQKTSPEGLLSPDGILNLNDGFHGALDLAGWNAQIEPAARTDFFSCWAGCARSMGQSW